MQEDLLRLRQARVGPLPIAQKFLDGLDVKGLLCKALGNEDYAEAIETLVKSALLRPDALYRIGRWADGFEEGLIRKNLSDDVLGRSLDRLFQADRASLLTKLALNAVAKFKVETSQIHNDSTSVKFTGAYETQNPKAIQLKRGHSKDHRPDLKQLVYSLSVTRDGAIPIHFKAYDGNQSDDRTHWEIWQSLRGFLGRSDFLYVADSKLCSTDTMKKIDRDQGYFLTIVPRTRAEVSEFADEAAASRLRWRPIHSQKVRRSKIDHFEAAEGLFQLREGYCVHWYRSSEKKIRDKHDREARIAVARGRLLALNEKKRRGPKSEKAATRAAEKIIANLKVQAWLKAVVRAENVERFKQTRKGKASASSLYKRSTGKSVSVSVIDDVDGLLRSAAMDGIFPITTNKDLSALQALKAYKFQPRLEKRHSLFKSVLQVAPVFLKKNERIEALMFVYFIAQTIGSLLERELRLAMERKGIKTLPLLPEGRPTRTPTTSHVMDRFEHCSRQRLFEGDRLVKTFAEPLAYDQQTVLSLLDIPASAFK